MKPDSSHTSDALRAIAAVPSVGREIVLPCLLLLGAMFNLTLVVAGLKEFVIDDLGGSVADATLFFPSRRLHIFCLPQFGEC